MSQLKQTILQYYLFVSWDCFESHNHLLMPCVHQSRKSTWSADLFDELCVNNDTTESQVGSILKNHHRVPCDPFWEEPWQMRIKSPCSFTSSAFYINGMYFKRFDICFLFNNSFFCKCWFVFSELLSVSYKRKCLQRMSVSMKLTGYKRIQEKWTSRMS